MKIGFVTTHEYHNFGTFLQCYALQRKLQDMGHDVEIIDYKRKELLRPIGQRVRILLGDIRRNPITNIHRLINWGKMKKRDALFKVFAKQHYSLSKEHYNTAKDLEQNPPVYDLYLSGSDQIWNPSLNGFIEPYFLTFAPDRATKVSYASSIGLSMLSDAEKIHLKQLLNGYKSISCREQTGVELINECGFKEVKCVLDPVFLLSPKEWLSLTKESSTKLPKEYNLTYFLDATDNKKMIAKQLVPNYEILNLTADIDCCTHSIYEAGPLDFLSLIYNCNHFCTDSFHGMVFALLFEKDFYVVPRHESSSERSQNSRIQDLLSLLHLEKRWIENENVVPTIPIDYKVVNEILRKQLDFSLEYLYDILQSHD